MTVFGWSDLKHAIAIFKVNELDDVFEDEFLLKEMLEIYY